MNRKLLGALLIVVIVGFAGYSLRWKARDLYYAQTKPAVPSAMPYPSATVLPPPQHATPSPSLPAATNLNIIFIAQAPLQVWDADHEEFCEEAAALMAASYLSGDKSVSSPDIADEKLYGIKGWEMTNLGHFEDTSAAETARILKEHLGVSKIKLISNPTVNDIKSWVSQGRAVLVPSAGRLLGNPNFKSPGPLYHMILIKGYTSDGVFITNDPGTRRGADYRYSPSVIMNAMHDWNDGDVLNGAKVVIVVG